MPRRNPEVPFERVDLGPNLETEIIMAVPKIT